MFFLVQDLLQDTEYMIQNYDILGLCGEFGGVKDRCRERKVLFASQSSSEADESSESSALGSVCVPLCTTLRVKYLKTVCKQAIDSSMAF